VGASWVLPVGSFCHRCSSRPRPTILRVRTGDCPARPSEHGDVGRSPALGSMTSICARFRALEGPPDPGNTAGGRSAGGRLGVPESQAPVSTGKLRLVDHDTTSGSASRPGPWRPSSKFGRGHPVEEVCWKMAAPSPPGRGDPARATRPNEGFVSARHDDVSCAFRP